ncbi:MAG TPA: hypothetical protein VMF66_09105 [Candidatus Acidoferrum sp.]|nr:hypothetical protein [Candidatus Acidoferrum sp.]
MKRIILRALVIGIVLSPVTEFVGSAFAMRGGIQYSPAITEAEMRQMDHLSFERVQALLAARTVKLTRTQALRQEIVLPFFWKRLAEGSMWLFAAVFTGCICMGVLQDRSRRVRVAGASHTVDT